MGAGAILGAPLMLSTLPTSLITLSIVRLRGVTGYVAPERTGFTRDLNYFLCAFVPAAITMYVPHSQTIVGALFSVTLVGVYVTYVVKMFRASGELVDAGHGAKAPGSMLLSRLGVLTHLTTIA